MPQGPFGDIKIFSGSESEPLAKRVIASLNDTHARSKRHRLDLGLIAGRRRHNDGEIRVCLGESVRGKDVYIIQSTNQPHENLVELTLMLGTARKAKARRVVAVIPYFGYGRSDWKSKPRECVAVVTMVKVIVAAGAHHIVTVDPHSHVVDAALDARDALVDVLSARPTFMNFFRKHRRQETFLSRNLVVVAPDAGAAELARAYAGAFEHVFPKELRGNVPIAVIDKRRSEPGKSEALRIVGNVRGRVALIVDDLLDTAGTVCKGAEALMSDGAEAVYVVETHPVLSLDAQDRLDQSPIKKVFVTDSIRRQYTSQKIMSVPIADLLAEAIWRIHNNISVDSLF